MSILTLSARGALRIACQALAILVVATVALDASGANAANITMVTQQAMPILPLSRPEPLRNPVLRLTGMIEDGDADKLREMLDRVQAQLPPPPRSSPSSSWGGSAGSASSAPAPPAPRHPLATIELSSIGGSLPEGIRIGELLRRRNVVAVVRKQDLCLSACALALVGGNAYREPPAYPADCNVEIGGKVAFHNFFLNRNGLRDVTANDPVASRLQGFADARGGAALLVKYAGEIGLPPNFTATLMARPVEEFQYVETIGQFLSLNICPIGLARPTAPLDKQAGNVCINALQLPPRRPALQVTPIQAAQAKQYMLERVQESMQSARARGRLAEQLASWSVMRVKEEVDKLYEDLRAAGLALPDILGPTFEVGINAADGYRTLCYVSLSATDPDAIDVVVQGGRGLMEAPRLPPENARRLFLFEQRDVVNPAPGGGANQVRSQDHREIDENSASASPATAGRQLPFDRDLSIQRQR